jgi:anaerobic magnesium-protoporphyrin IX monomethyl ester cyclase
MASGREMPSATVPAKPTAGRPPMPGLLPGGPKRVLHFRSIKDARVGASEFSGGATMQGRKKVMLITPPYHCGMVESAGVWMPLGLAYLAGSLQAAGYDPMIYDAMSLFHDLPEISHTIADNQPDFVAVTAYTATVNAAREVLALAREAAPQATTVIGGVHPTFMADEMLSWPEVDYVVRGEGEAALPELLDRLNGDGEPSDVAGVSCRTADGNPLHGPERELAADLDRLPVAWDLLDWPVYFYRTKAGSRLAIVSWARGCTERCSFCSQQRFWRMTWRPRSIDSIIEELRLLKDRFGVDTVEVADEYPTRDAARWEAILDRLIAEDLGLEFLLETRADDIVRDERQLEKYRRAGILHMYVGVESTRQDRLDAMVKNLKVEQSRQAIHLLNQAGIITETSFLLGFPDETRADVQNTLDLSFSYEPDLTFFLAITPWPYSDYYQQVKDKVEVTDYSLYNLSNPIIHPGEMTREELSAELSRCFAEFYRNKMRSLGSMPPDKQRYLLAVAKLLRENSYLSKEVMGAMGHPEAVGHPGAALHPGAMVHPGAVGHPGAGGHPGASGHPQAAGGGERPPEKAPAVPSGVGAA